MLYAKCPFGSAALFRIINLRGNDHHHPAVYCMGSPYSVLAVGDDAFGLICGDAVPR